MKIAVIALEDVVATELVGIIDYVDFTNSISKRIGGEEATVSIFSTKNSQLKSSSNLVFCCEPLTNLQSDYDVVWFLGSKFESYALLSQQCQLIQSYAQLLEPVLSRAHYVAGSCTGVPLMLSASSSQPNCVTTSWWLGKYFSINFPEIKLTIDKAFIQAGKHLTSGATYCFQHIYLALLDKFYDGQLIELFKKWLVLPTPVNNQSPFVDIAMLDTLAGSRLNSVVEYIKAYMSNDLSNDTLASIAAMSTRTLIRTFQSEYGMTPGKYVLMVRLDKAMKLLISAPNKKAFDIATAIGYHDIGAFTKQFERYFGNTLSYYRKNILSQLILDKK